MPAHMGIVEKLKLPIAVITVKLKQLMNPSDVRLSGVTTQDILDQAENSRQSRENACTSHTIFRSVLDARYGPLGNQTKVSAFEWQQNLGPGGFVDVLVEQSFEFEVISEVVLIVRKSDRSELKRIELIRPGGAVEIVWSI